MKDGEAIDIYEEEEDSEATDIYEEEEDGEAADIYEEEEDSNILEILEDIAEDTHSILVWIRFWSILSIVSGAIIFLASLYW